MAATMATGLRIFYFLGFLLPLFSLAENQGSTKPPMRRLQEHHPPLTDEHHHNTPSGPVKFERRRLLAEKKQARMYTNTELLQPNEIVDLRNRITAIQGSNPFGTRTREKYSIWRREHGQSGDDTILMWMKDQIILARVLSRIAHARRMVTLNSGLEGLIINSSAIIAEADSDAELKKGAWEQALQMDHELSVAKDKLYDCELVARKLRALVRSIEETVIALKKKSMFLMHVALWSTWKPLHCLYSQLTNDYFLRDHSHMKLPDERKLKDPYLYHYTILSDNVLATSVVVSSAIINAKEPGKHVFHIVTDRLNFAAMKMWFIAHPPLLATVEVKSINMSKWLNSSYSPILQLLESSKMKKLRFDADHSSEHDALDEDIKHRNPKYLSMLNHIRFYLPELFPELDKILFLDDDVVVQRDLTPLWSVDMKGMVNGAVETCNKKLHRFGSHLNFSKMVIIQNFDPNACAWAFGMNMFDLKQWRLHDLTGLYHTWQELNEGRELWQLGTLPPGLMTFYRFTYLLEKRWHRPGLGYQPSINTKEIEEAAVIHYNGNNKPWTDLAISKYKGYWSKYVDYSDPYLQLCNINE